MQVHYLFKKKKLHEEIDVLILDHNILRGCCAQHTAQPPGFLSAD